MTTPTSPLADALRLIGGAFLVILYAAGIALAVITIAAALGSL